MRNAPLSSRPGLLRVVVAPCLLIVPALYAASEEEAVKLEPITVHAARLANLRMDAPVAVTAYEGAFLHAAGIGDYQDLAPLVPGLFVSGQSVDFVSLNLRGLTSDNSDPRMTPRVSVFQDGVGLNTAHGNSVALFDLDNVAVFKGPQATRFGEGVQSGALSLTSNRARDESTAALMLGVGDFNARRVEAHVNQPVVAEKLFARVAVHVNERDGYVKNLADGSDLQGEGTVAVRASLRWKPAAATTADLIFNVQRDDTPGVAFKSAVIPVSPSSTDTDPHTPANLNRGSELFVERTVIGLTGIVRHELNEAWTVVSTSGWRELDGVNEFDADGSYLYLLELGERFEGRQFSQELRLEFDAGGRFTASVGANVMRKENDQRVIVRTDENTLWQFATGTPPPFALNPDYREEHYNESTLTTGDVFGRADYKLTERLTLGGGLRFIREHIVSGYQSFVAPVTGTLPVQLLPTAGGGNSFFQVTPGRLENSTYVSAWAGELDASYAVTPRVTAYASVSRGRRSPVLDFDLITLAPREIAEETVWNYEAGVRGFSPGRRLRYDFSVFEYHFDHFQTERVAAGEVIPFDGGRARGRGFETTLQADLAREVSVFAAYGFTDARFAERDGEGNPQLYGGDTFRLTSRHVLSVGGTWTLPMTDAGVFFITPVYTYRSAYFFEDNNAQNGGTLRQGGYGLLNLRVGWRSRDQRWEVVAHVSNVFEKKYLLDAGNIGSAYDIPTNVPAAPRLAGVNATVRF